MYDGVESESLKDNSTAVRERGCGMATWWLLFVKNETSDLQESQYVA